MSDCRLARIFISPKVANWLIVNENKVEKSTVTWYPLAVRALICLIMHFCSDLVYLIEVLSRFCSISEYIYVKLVKHILQYVSGTLE